MTGLIVDALDWTRATLDFQHHGGDIGEVLAIERAFEIEPLHITGI